MEVEEQDLELEAGQPAVAAAAADKTKEETVTVSKAEYARMQRELVEVRNSERDWARLAQRAQPEPETPAADEKVDVDEFLTADDRQDPDADDETLLEDLTSGKGTAALRKRGFVTIAEAKRISAETATKVTQKLIRGEREKITSESAVLRDFPQLSDGNSPLFKATATELNALNARFPKEANSPALMFAAATAAQAKLGGKQQPKPAADDDADLDYDRAGEAEEDRRARADAQDGSSTRRSRGEGDDTISAEARQFNKGMGISDEDFLKSKRELGARGRRR